MHKLLHFIYTVIVILFLNAFFQTIESAVNFSGISLGVYIGVKYLLFLIIIAVSYLIFLAKLNRKQKERNKSCRNYEQAIKGECTFDPQSDSVFVDTEEDLQIFCDDHPLIDDFMAKVKGVTYKNDDGTSRQEVLSNCLRGEPVFFRKYWYNGKPAYAVGTAHGQIGNLSADLAESLDYCYGQEAYMSGTISDITGGVDGLYYGCILHILIYGPSSSD